MSNCPVVEDCHPLWNDQTDHVLIMAMLEPFSSASTKLTGREPRRVPCNVRSYLEDDPNLEK